MLSDRQLELFPEARARARARARAPIDHPAPAFCGKRGRAFSAYRIALLTVAGKLKLELDQALEEHDRQSGSCDEPNAAAKPATSRDDEP